MGQTNQKERRKTVRYRPKDGTMAVNNHALGPIVNISMGGLSFRYLEGTSAELSSDSLGIFLGSDDILIDQLSTRIVTDRLISKGSAFLKTCTRQRSIQFTDLNKKQQTHLQEFISKRTQGMY